MLKVIKNFFRAMLLLVKSDFKTMIKIIKLTYDGVRREYYRKRIQRLEDKINACESTIALYRERKFIEIQKFNAGYSNTNKEDEING